MSGELVKHIIEDVKDFDPDQIFGCGQCFRWNKVDDGCYTGLVSGSFARVSFRPDEVKKSHGKLIIWSSLFRESSSLRDRFWRDYFDLDRDYGAIKKFLVKDDVVMKSAVKDGSGIRILNQDKWETLISFIISQNNNIPRIKGCIERLCSEYGEPIGKFNGKALYAFPTIERLSKLREKDLDPCKLGYRAKYLEQVSRQVAFDGGSLLSIGDKIETEKAEQYLLTLSGVGPKVAHCVLLFSMKKTEAFPVDVWVKRVMNRFYDIDEDDVASMKEYAKKHFGEWGGIAQQYLFNHIRTLAEKKPKVYDSLKFDERPASTVPDILID